MATFEEELDAYLATPEMQQATKAYRIKIGGTGGSGTTKAVKAYAQEAIKAIIASLPSSLTSGSTRNITAKDLKVADISVNSDGDYEAKLEWNKDAIHRDSLYADGYPDGVDDIVELLTQGFKKGGKVKTAHVVYGEWHNKTVFGRRSRQADPFLQTAVDRFNAEHAKDNVTLILPDEYTIQSHEST